MTGGKKLTFSYHVADRDNDQSKETVRTRAPSDMHMFENQAGVDDNRASDPEVKMDIILSFHQKAAALKPAS